MNLNILQEPEEHPFELFSRRLLLRRMLVSAAGLPLLEAQAFLPAPLLAATEDSPETENNWEGPFYKPGAPLRSVLLERGMAGTPLTVNGRVLYTRGRPLKGALLDVWHADVWVLHYERLAGIVLRGWRWADDGCRREAERRDV
jgi:hypothetical protein